MMIQQDLH